MRILFVCLGNICRSPMAECIMAKMAADAGIGCDAGSCGLISYHEGEAPDSRMMQAAASRGYQLRHRARKIEERDFADYDLIVGMDHENTKRLRSICPPAYLDKIHIVSEYFVDAQGSTVPDPYYGGIGGFYSTISLLEDACAGIIRKIQRP